MINQTADFGGQKKRISSENTFNIPLNLTGDWAKNVNLALRNQKLPSANQLNTLLALTRKKLEMHPNVIEIDVKNECEITLVGDTHGQFYDVLNLLSLNEPPSNTNPYLFNGDWVDRGSWGVEITVLLFVYKLVYPDSVFLLRGNHESLMCTKEYGFKNEVEDKYNHQMYLNFMFAFNALPIAAVINKRVFVAHGGLFSRPNVRLSEINEINRFKEPGDEGGELIMAQLLWADPMEGAGQHQSPRPFGCKFGPNVTDGFLEANKLQLVIRSHEVRQEGFLVEQDGRLITLFSAPNYMQETNKAAYLRLKGGDLEIFPFQFTAVAAPPAKLYYDVNTCKAM